MSALETVVSALLWLGGLAVLLRWPGRTIGFGTALVAWTVDPAAFWAVLGLTWATSVAWGRYGPSERMLSLFPELSVALVAGVVAVLAGGQVAAAALAVLVLALGVFASTTLAGLGRHRDTDRALPLPGRRELPAAPTSGRLGKGAWQVNFAPCPTCGGLMVATGRDEPAPGGGPIFLAQATCTRCGLHLVGLGDANDPNGEVVWIDPPQNERKDIA